MSVSPIDAVVDAVVVLDDDVDAVGAVGAIDAVDAVD
jgi:hypothetical protein